MVILLKILNLAVTLTAAPLLLGIIIRVKAWFAGRTGQPLLQPYYDIWKLLRKGTVYSVSTSWVFRAGPLVSLAVTLTAALLLPMGGLPAVFAFDGDFLVFVYLLGLLRFFMIVSALDTGSSFEGMGSSREAAFSALCEPALLLGLAAVAKITGQVSLTPMAASLQPALWTAAGPAFVLVGFALIIVFLSENCRIPVDDPTTHLELTMIHEAMVLDHGGLDLGMLQYAAALKMWLLGLVLVGVAVPIHSGFLCLDTAATLLCMGLLAVLVGIIESSMARIRLLRIPPLLIGAAAFSVLALVLVYR